MGRAREGWLHADFHPLKVLSHHGQRVRKASKRTQHVGNQAGKPESKKGRGQSSNAARQQAGSSTSRQGHGGGL